MNRSELIEAAADESGLSKGDVDKALKSVLTTIQGALERGEKVSISGFGNFEVRERAARTGRNPQTGESIEVAASKAPAFKAATALKKAING